MFNLFGSALGLSPQHFLAIAAALMIPTVWLPNLSALSFLGVFGVAATTSVVASVCVDGVVSLRHWCWVPAAVRIQDPCSLRILCRGGVSVFDTDGGTSNYG